METHTRYISTSCGIFRVIVPSSRPENPKSAERYESTKEAFNRLARYLLSDRMYELYSRPGIDRQCPPDYFLELTGPEISTLEEADDLLLAATCPDSSPTIDVKHEGAVCFFASSLAI